MIIIISVQTSIVVKLIGIHVRVCQIHEADKIIYLWHIRIYDIQEPAGGGGGVRVGVRPPPPPWKYKKNNFLFAASFCYVVLLIERLLHHVRAILLRFSPYGVLMLLFFFMWGAFIVFNGGLFGFAAPSHTKCSAGAQPMI